MKDTITICIVLLAVCGLLWVGAPRQARRLMTRAPRSLRPPSAAGRARLERELRNRLRFSASGSGLGVVIVAIPLLVQEAFGKGPTELTVVATVLASTVVTGVATEAAAVLRCAPRQNHGPRAAVLVPRAAHADRGGTLAEVALAALALAAVALGVSLIARDIDGGAGAVGAGTGAVVVIVVCAFVRTTFVRHSVAATDAEDLAVRAAAGAVTTDRFSENLVASGGMLTLVALLVPATAQGHSSQLIGAVLGAATLAVMGYLVVSRRAARQQVHA